MLTLERLKEVLWFEQDAGRFYWNTKIKGIRIGTEAGSFDAHGYGQIRIDRGIYKEHRLVWFYVTGKWPVDQIDHVNHARRDNRFDNLREVDNYANHLNRPMQATNTSGFVGVSFNKRLKSYEAYITVDGERKRLGRFKEFSDAVAARRAANKEYGYHKNHGIGKSIPRKPAQSNLRGRPSHTRGNDAQRSLS